MNEDRKDGYWLYQVTKVRNAHLVRQMKVIHTWVEMALAGPFTEREPAEALLVQLAWRTPAQFRLEIRYGYGPTDLKERQAALRGMEHAGIKQRG